MVMMLLDFSAYSCFVGFERWLLEKGREIGRLVLGTANNDYRYLGRQCSK